jgi:hypothetical protein
LRPGTTAARILTLFTTVEAGRVWAHPTCVPRPSSVHRIALCGKRRSSFQTPRAYSLIHELLGIQTTAECPELSQLIPNDPNDFFSGRTLAPAQTFNQSRAGVQGAIVKLIQLEKRRSVRARVIRHAGEPHTTKSDAVHILAVTSRSQTTRVLQSSLWFPQNRIDSITFTKWARWHLTLPQTIRTGQGATIPLYDVEVQQCGVNHGITPRYCDPSGDHAAACQSAHRERYRLHNSIRDLLGKSASALGLDVRVEPATSSILAYQYSPEQCRSLFPKTSTKANKKRADRLSFLLDAVPGADGEAKAALIAECKALVDQAPAGDKGLRVDLSIVGDNGEEVWVDVGLTHTSGKTGRDAALRFLAGESAEGPPAGATVDRPSPPVESYAKRKMEKYNGLVDLGRLLHHRRKRRSSPKFIAGVISHEGEFSAGVFSLIEILSSRKFALAAAGQDEPWWTPTQVSAAFRMELKDMLASAVVKGWGLMLSAVGFPPST